MNLTTFWDLDDKARAALTEADVTRYLDAELMTRGVLRVVAPEFEAVPPDPELPKRTYYQCGGLLFDTVEQAAALANARPLKQGTRYLGGRYSYSNQVNYAEPADLEITAVNITTAEAVTLASSVLDRRGAVMQANEAKREAFEKASKEQDKVLAGVWDDWHRCRARAARLRQVVDTFEAYVRTANGDRAMASAFLTKVFDDETIQDAREWHGADIPFGAAAMPAGPSHPVAVVPAAADDIAF